MSVLYSASTTNCCDSNKSKYHYRVIEPAEYAPRSAKKQHTARIQYVD